ncbi:hypothetical protein [Bacillus salacetis]|nr:hypothetical protein [Bacillus salacetis]
MKLAAILSIPILTIISWLAIGYWSKAAEDYEKNNEKPDRRNMKS